MTTPCSALVFRIFTPPKTTNKKGGGRAAETRPDIVLMYIGMTGLSSCEATRQIKKNRAETKILFLTMYDDEDYLVECMQVGAGGYVLKDSPAAQLLGAVREVQ